MKESRTLEGKVVVVTGASRGAGRGIACVLGEAGATVYVTGRSRPGAVTQGRSETLDETAEQVTSRGGRGIAVGCDHTDETQVRAFFARVQEEQGRLDVLVNNVWGGYEEMDGFSAPFWEQPFAARWHGMFEAGVKAHLLTTHSALPLMVRQRSGLVLSTVAWSEGTFLGNVFYDVSKASIVRFHHVLAEELRPRGIAALAVAPGFMRTERVLEAVKEPSELATTESPEYVGRGIAALAADPSVLELSGRVFFAGELAERYGLVDVDGRLIHPFRLTWEACTSCGGSGQQAGGADCPSCHGRGKTARRAD